VFSVNLFSYTIGDFHFIASQQRSYVVICIFFNKFDFGNLYNNNSWNYSSSILTDFKCVNCFLNVFFSIISNFKQNDYWGKKKPKPNLLINLRGQYHCRSAIKTENINAGLSIYSIRVYNNCFVNDDCVFV